MATNKKPNFVFRKQLFRISNSLTGSDVTNLKFLCGDILARRVVEDASTAFELFSALEGKNQLSPHKLDFLEDLLDAVGKRHLVRELKEALANPASYGEGEATGSPPSPPVSGLDSMKFSTFLVSIGDELPERDLRNVAYFFQSYNVTGLSAQEVQKLREPAQLFKILKQEKIISPTNLSKLRTVMDAIGRKDLCEKINEYLQSVPGGRRSSGGSSFSMDSSPTTSMHMKPAFDSMSDDSSHFSFDGKVVKQYPPQGPLSGNRDLAQPNIGVPVEEEGEEEKRQRMVHIGIHGSIRRESDQPVAMEEGPEGQLTGQPGLHPAGQLSGGDPVGQLAGRPSGQLAGRPSGQLAGQPSGHIAGRPVGLLAGHTVDGSIERRDRTRTQMLQLQLNEMTAKMSHLESQLEHERVHRHAMAEQREHSNSELVRELDRKVREVNSLRQETAGLRNQLLSGDDSELYPMNAVPPHGKAIVIVNDEFVQNPSDMIILQRRRGAKQDMRLFKETFETLGYEVECHSNLTAEEIHQVVSRAASENHDAHDSFVCCVSTHGDDIAMYGCDSIRVKRSELVQYVKQSKSLYRKPKMFFLQACRTKSASGASGTSLTYQPDAAEQDADVFTANASTANYASYRDHTQGSWFVMAVSRVFTHYFNTLTLDEMMHKVNNVVCNAQGYIQDGDPHRADAMPQEARQCAETTSSFRLGLRFRFTSQ